MSAALLSCATAAQANATPTLSQTRAALRSDPLLIGRAPAGDGRGAGIDVLLGKTGAEYELRRWARSGAPASERADAWHLLCEAALRRMSYRSALAACAEGDRLQGQAATEALRSLLTFLQTLPATRWSRPGLEMPLVRDSDGTRRLAIGPRGSTIEAIVDTGAELSLMMESVARRFHARPIGTAQVGTSTSDVSTGMAVVDRLPVGDNVVENLVVSVVPDAQLTFPDGTSIPAILGLPVLLAAERFAFLDHGTRLALGTRAPRLQAATAAPLYWDPSGFGFAARFRRAIRAVHFDSGSKRVELFPAGLTALSPAELATRIAKPRQVTGIGGNRTEKASEVPVVQMWVGKQPWRIAPMQVAETDSAGEAGRIGAPLFDRFSTAIFDTKAMLMMVRP
jgi:hypothetical protein